MRKIDLPRAFDTEEKCFDFLKSIRWPNGEFECRGCSHNSGIWLKTRKRMECRACGLQTSVTAGSLFHGAKIPLWKLFSMLINVLTGIKKTPGKVAEELNIGYATAWLWMVRIRGMLNSHFPPNKSFMVDLAVLGSILFRRSRDSEPVEREKSNKAPPDKTLPALSARRKKSVGAALQFVTDPHQGISRKYAEQYIAQFAFTLRKTAPTLIEFLRICLQSKPITRQAVLSYSAPSRIRLPLLKR